MKKILVVLVFLAIIFTSISTYGSAFKVIDSKFTVSGHIWYPVALSYSETSSAPVSAGVSEHLHQTYVNSEAGYNWLYAEQHGSFDEDGDAILSWAFAQTRLLIKPTFSGLNDPISFEGFWLASVELFDLTIGQEIAFWSSNESTVNPFILSYAGWNPNHTYELWMSADSGEDYSNHSTYLVNNMEFTFPTAEPATLFLLVLGLIGLIGFRIKKF